MVDIYLRITCCTVYWLLSWRKILTRDLQLTRSIIQPKFNNFLRMLLFILLFHLKVNGKLSRNRHDGSSIK